MIGLLAALLLAGAAGPPTAASNETRTLASAQPKTPNYIETSRQVTGILDRFMSLGYDKRVRPNYGGPPVEVNVTMRILSISSVSEVMMDFTADFYFRQTWRDPRLSFRKLGDIQTLYVGAEVSKKIWLPDTFFGNEKMAYFHEATTPNVFLRIDHSGEVYRSIRLTVTSSCPMNLQYFPMDRQRCTIEAESYGYNVKDIIYRWADSGSRSAVERDNQISLPQFDIVRTVQKYRLEELSSGTYSRLIAEIHFARRMGYYLIQIYIPSSLIVVISWVSFWLHRNASPARVQLGVTTVLTMTTLMSSTNAALPKISYVKSIDIFLGTCFIMVFAALLEYATVGYLGKRIAMRKAQAQHSQSQAQARLFAQLQASGAQGDLVVPMGATGATAAPVTHSQAASAPGGALFPETPLSSVGALNGGGHSGQAPLFTLPGAVHQAPLMTMTAAGLLPPAPAEFGGPLAAESIPQAPERHASRCHSCKCHKPAQAALHHTHAADHHHHHHQQQHHHHHQHCHQHPSHLQSDLSCCIASGTVARASRLALTQCPHCHHESQVNPSTPSAESHGHALAAEHLQATGRLIAASTSATAVPTTAHSSPIQEAAAFAGGSPGGVKAAATAAAAAFVNLHRRKQGLPPSNNPNFAKFAWTGQYDRSLETIFGVRPSDIDKYSRVVFPVCFVCFQLMYWIVYLHISAFLDTETQPGMAT